MAYSHLIRKLTNRGAVRGARRLVEGLVVMALVVSLMVAAALFPVPAMAQGNAPERVKVLVEDVTESTAADFARGQVRGIAVAGDGEQARLQGQGGEFVSGVIALPFAATHLGLHWTIRGASPASAEVAVRTGANGHAWSEWYPLTIEAEAQRPDGREVFAALAPGNRARVAQYRVTFGSTEMVALEAMTVTALNSVDGPREAVSTETSGTVDFTTPDPDNKTFTVITRAGWGCNEDNRFDGSVEKWPEMYVPAKKVVIHHTATSNTYTDGAAEVRAIYTYHTGTLGWGDIGYNALVDKYGNIYEGRHGRGAEFTDEREILSADVVAGHAYAYNYGSLGIAAIGNYQKAQPSAEMKTAIDDITTFECARHYIDPMEASAFLRSDDLWHEGLNNISGHDDVNSTQCPGRNLKSYLPTLREHVDSRLGWSSDAIPDATLTSASAREVTVDEPVTLTRQNADTYSLEGWYKASGQEDIEYLSGYSDGDRVQVWDTGATWPLDNMVTFLQSGHYTMHVRQASGGYEANLTFLVKDASATGAIHVGDLDGVSTSVGTKWTATVMITLHDANCEPVEGATVSGAWSGGYSGTGSCYTGADGVCSVTTGSMTRRSTSVTFTVTGVAKESAVYDTAANHDPDSDSDGTSITIDKP